MDTLWKKLLLAIFVGGVIVALAYGVTDPGDRPKLLIDSLQHLGVIVIGIAAVEVVWAWAGGSPIELDLKRLLGLNENLNSDLKDKVTALTALSNDIVSTSTRIESSVQHMTTIVTAANRTGLVDFGAKQDEVAYTPTIFAEKVGNAREAIDLCGCTLGLCLHPRYSV